MRADEKADGVSGTGIVVRADEKLRFWNSNRLFGVVVSCLDKLASFFRNYPDMKPRIPSVLITFALVCFALSPKVQAVVPAPDGGYPNFTTAEGTKALFSLATGSANTAVGWFSLKSNTAGSFNTATGAGTLLFNTADANTAFGAAPLLFNTTGVNGTAVGAGRPFKQQRWRGKHGHWRVRSQ